MSQHSAGVIPGHGNGFCSLPKLDTVTCPGHLIPSSHLLTPPSSHTGRRETPHYGCHDIFVCIFIICFIVLWLDYYFVFPSDAMLAAVKRYEVSGSARSHGTFHLLNLHQNIHQKPPPPASSLQPTQSHPSSEPDI